MVYRHPDEITTAVQKFLETSPEWEFSGRKLIAVESAEFGKKQMKYSTRTRPHQLGHWHTPGAPDAEQDTVRYADTYVPVWETTYEYTYTNWDEVDDKFLMDSANDCVHEVLRLEDKAIVDGHINPAGTYYDGLTGLTGAAGNTYTETAGTWAAGSDPYISLLGARNLLYADAIQGPYILAINPTYAGYLALPDANGNITVDLVRKGLTDITDIFYTDNTNATYPALLIKKDPRYAKLTLVEDVRVLPPFQSSPKEYVIQINHAISLKVAYPNSVCRLTGI